MSDAKGFNPRWKLTPQDFRGRAKGERNAAEAFEQARRDVRGYIVELEKGAIATVGNTESLLLARKWLLVRDRQVDQCRENALAYDRIANGLQPYEDDERNQTLADAAREDWNHDR